MAAAEQIVFVPGTRSQNALPFPPELQRLLSICGGVQQPNELKALAPEDWARLLQLADAHGVIPLLRARAANVGIPTGALQEISSLDAANSRKSLRLTRELLRILDHFGEKEISVLPYKGPALSQLLFADVAMRQAGDLDLLVLPSDVGRAVAALQELGYKPHLTLAPAQHGAYLKSGYEYVFDSGSGQNVVELKWAILPRFYAVDFDVTALFGRAGSLMIGGAKTRVLCPEDYLLVLCVHAAKHLWAKLCWLSDIHQLLKTARINWVWVQQEAQRLGMQRILRLNLLLIQELLDSTMLEGVSDFFERDSSTEELLPKVLPLVLHAGGGDAESFAYFRTISSLRERKVDRTRFWWRLAATPGLNEWAAMDLPQSLSSLYRGVRVYRLGRRALSYPFQATRRTIHTQSGILPRS